MIMMIMDSSVIASQQKGVTPIPNPDQPNLMGSGRPHQTPDQTKPESMTCQVRNKLGSSSGLRKPMGYGWSVLHPSIHPSIHPAGAGTLWAGAAKSTKQAKQARGKWTERPSSDKYKHNEGN